MNLIFILCLLPSFLIVTPIFAYKYAKKKYPRRKYLITGVATGLIILPFSWGLYGFYYIPYIGLIPGMVGLVLGLLHIKLWDYLRCLGIDVNLSMDGGERLLLFDIYNGIVWGCIYGAAGFIIDLLSQRTSINKGLHKIQGCD